MKHDKKYILVLKPQMKRQPKFISLISVILRFIIMAHSRLVGKQFSIFLALMEVLLHNFDSLGSMDMSGF